MATARSAWNLVAPRRDILWLQREATGTLWLCLEIGAWRGHGPWCLWLPRSSRQELLGDRPRGVLFSQISNGKVNDFCVDFHRPSTVRQGICGVRTVAPPWRRKRPGACLGHRLRGALHCCLRVSELAERARER